MKFSSVELGNDRTYGLVEGETIHLANDSMRARYPDLKSVITSNALASVGVELGQSSPVAMDRVSFLPVIPNPEKIFCAGLNYQTHRDESRSKSKEPPKHPIIFARFANSLTGHGRPIIKAANSDAVDYEGEVAAVIGRRCRHVAREDAYSYVAGYACFNDVSMRDWQMRSSQWVPGKNFPSSGPFGPYLVTPDEVGPLDNLMMRTVVDGAVMQETPLGKMIFPIDELIEFISGFTVLEPGDVIVTGTTGGVGFARTPPVLLTSGKLCEVIVDKIGHLSNPVIDEAT